MRKKNLEKQNINIDKIIEHKNKTIKRSKIAIIIAFFMYICLNITFLYLTPNGVTSIKIIVLLIATFFCFLGFYESINWIKQEKKEIKDTLDGKFKIIEDKIYDRRCISSTKTSNIYKLCTMQCGEFRVKEKEFFKVKKDDYVYIIIYGEDLEIKPLKTYEIKYFFKNKCSIDDTVKKFLVPYNEKNGEKAFNKRIENIMKTREIKIKCKSCGKKYKIKENNKICPYCNEEYAFDYKDFAGENKWY